MSRIYLSAQWSRRAEVAEAARLLREDGHTVVSRWHDGPPDDDASEDLRAWEKWAEAAYLGITGADVFVAFTELPGTLSRGGRHVEYGMAVVANEDRLVVGPVESVFYALADAVYADVAALRKALL